MNALAFDFDYGDEVVEPAPKPVRRLYAVRGAVDAPGAEAPVAPEARTLEDALAAPAPVSAVASTAPRLDLILGGAMTSLRRSTTVACPVCETGTMAPRWSASSGVVGGRCGDCGATLE